LAVGGDFDLSCFSADIYLIDSRNYLLILDYSQIDTIQLFVGVMEPWNTLSTTPNRSENLPLPQLNKG
jgi:hypothetical protein